ncbi:MAG: hypothetical protein OXC19_06045 [Bryobacterales bacterium]|nr:hypothetical protein [Bryobacterales bacterium]
MTKHTGASTVLVALAGGSFFSGVATALALVQFNILPGHWKIALMIASATIAVGLLLASLAIRILHAGSGTQSQIYARFSPPTLAGTAPEASTRSMEPDLAEDGNDQLERGDSSRAHKPHESRVQQLSRGGPPDGSAPLQDTSSSEPAELRTSASEESTAGMGSAPKAVVEVQPADLVAAWDTYRRNGDGHFHSRGLQRVLDELGIEATVNTGDPVGLGRRALIVETPNRQGYFYVLPSFASSPREVANWFKDSSSGALTGRTERVISVAEGRHTATGAEVIKQGVVA